MRKEIFDQMMRVRDSGATNMYDVYGVQKYASDNLLFEFADYLCEHKKEYWDFMMAGKPPVFTEEDSIC